MGGVCRGVQGGGFGSCSRSSTATATATPTATATATATQQPRSVGDRSSVWHGGATTRGQQRAWTKHWHGAFTGPMGVEWRLDGISTVDSPQQGLVVVEHWRGKNEW